MMGLKEFFYNLNGLFSAFIPNIPAFQYSIPMAQTGFILLSVGGSIWLFNTPELIKKLPGVQTFYCFFYITIVRKSEIFGNWSLVLQMLKLWKKEHPSLSWEWRVYSRGLRTWIRSGKTSLTRLMQPARCPGTDGSLNLILCITPIPYRTKLFQSDPVLYMILNSIPKELTLTMNC